MPPIEIGRLIDDVGLPFFARLHDDERLIEYVTASGSGQFGEVLQLFVAYRRIGRATDACARLADELSSLKREKHPEWWDYLSRVAREYGCGT